MTQNLISAKVFDDPPEKGEKMCGTNVHAIETQSIDRSHLKGCP